MMKLRFMAIHAMFFGCQGVDEYCCMVESALNFGLASVAIKEIVYQAVDYLGIGRVFLFLKETNDIFETKGIPLPLEGQVTTTMEDRLEKGAQAQVDIFCDGMKDFYKGGHINRWLAVNCSGDYYTRIRLDLKQREMITCCFCGAGWL